MPKKKKIPISWECEGVELDSYDLAEVAEKYYDKLGIDADSVEDIHFKFVDVPGHVYAELGVGKPTHPVAGSYGVNILLTNGSKAEFQIVSFYDFNVGKTHENGTPHWNYNPRLIDTHGNEKLLSGKHVKGFEHVIRDSPWIELNCPRANGKTQKIRIYRDDFKSRRT